MLSSPHSEIIRQQLLPSYARHSVDAVSRFAMRGAVTAALRLSERGEAASLCQLPRVHSGPTNSRIVRPPPQQLIALTPSPPLLSVSTAAECKCSKKSFATSLWCKVDHRYWRPPYAGYTHHCRRSKRTDEVDGILCFQRHTLHGAFSIPQPKKCVSHLWVLDSRCSDTSNATAAKCVRRSRGRCYLLGCECAVLCSADLQGRPHSDANALRSQAWKRLLLVHADMSNLPSVGPLAEWLRRRSQVPITKVAWVRTPRGSFLLAASRIALSAACINCTSVNERSKRAWLGAWLGLAVPIVSVRLQTLQR